MSQLLAFLFFPFDSTGALYALLFAILILSGIGVPIPEEISLLLGGYLAYLGLVNFWPAVYALSAGIIVADILGYCMGRFFGRWVWEKVFGRFRSSRRFLARGEQYFETYGDLVVVISRPLIGVRTVVPILAGNFKMNFLKFLLFDAIVAIPWTLLLVYTSFHLGFGLDAILGFEDLKYVAFGASAFAVGIFVGIWYIGRKKKDTGDMLAARRERV